MVKMLDEEWEELDTNLQSAMKLRHRTSLFQLSLPYRFDKEHLTFSYYAFCYLTL